MVLHRNSTCLQKINIVTKLEILNSDKVKLRINFNTKKEKGATDSELL